MGLFLLLGLVVASAPDAAVGSCALPSVVDAAERGAAEHVAGVAGPAVRLREVDGPSGSGGYVTRREWLVTPGTCRTVALQLDCAGGHPGCSAKVLHRPGQPPTDAERALLLSWLGGGRLDAQRAEHQAARTPGPLGLPPQPELPESPEEEASEDEAPAPLTVRAVTQPPPRWLKGPPVPQALSWTESGTGGEQEEASQEGPEGFVSSGRFYDVHRGDCCVREDEARVVGTARLRFFSSPSRAIQKVTYVVLEQPKRHRSAWLVASGSGFHLLGVHRGRAWLEVPTYMDPGFSLVAVDLDSGAAWHLDLARTPTFEPEAYRARAVTREGLVLKASEEDAPGGAKTVPWALLERALQQAKHPGGG